MENADKVCRYVFYPVVPNGALSPPGAFLQLRGDERKGAVGRLGTGGFLVEQTAEWLQSRSQEIILPFLAT